VSCLPLTIEDHRASGLLVITWADGSRSRLSHALLRAHCRCAACEQLRRSGTSAADLPSDLRLDRVEPVGDQGLNLGFTDGHARGIFPWAYLRELGAAESATERRAPARV
jgi:DUF971 family protein